MEDNTSFHRFSTRRGLGFEHGSSVHAAGIPIVLGDDGWEEGKGPTRGGSDKLAAFFGESPLQLAGTSASRRSMASSTGHHSWSTSSWEEAHPGSSTSSEFGAHSSASSGHRTSSHSAWSQISPRSAVSQEQPPSPAPRIPAFPCEYHELSHCSFLRQPLKRQADRKTTGIYRRRKAPWKDRIIALSTNATQLSIDGPRRTPTCTFGLPTGTRGQEAQACLHDFKGDGMEEHRRLWLSAGSVACVADGVDDVSADGLVLRVTGAIEGGDAGTAGRDDGHQAEWLLLFTKAKDLMLWLNTIRVVIEALRQADARFRTGNTLFASASPALPHFVTPPPLRSPSRWSPVIPSFEAPALDLPSEVLADDEVSLAPEPPKETGRGRSGSAPEIFDMAAALLSPRSRRNSQGEAAARASRDLGHGPIWAEPWEVRQAPPVPTLPVISTDKAPAMPTRAPPPPPPVPTPRGEESSPRSPSPARASMSSRPSTSSLRLNKGSRKSSRMAPPPRSPAPHHAPPPVPEPMPPSTPAAPRLRLSHPCLSPLAIHPFASFTEEGSNVAVAACDATTGGPSISSGHFHRRQGSHVLLSVPQDVGFSDDDHSHLLAHPEDLGLKRISLRSESPTDPLVSSPTSAVPSRSSSLGRSVAKSSRQKSRTTIIIPPPSLNLDSSAASSVDEKRTSFTGRRLRSDTVSSLGSSVSTSASSDTWSINALSPLCGYTFPSPPPLSGPFPFSPPAFSIVTTPTESDAGFSPTSPRHARKESSTMGRTMHPIVEGVSTPAVAL